tara:strand:+ start:80 stop:355 length:276 start_codon:yes stop_codon:yes gene_type:complete
MSTLQMIELIQQHHPHIGEIEAIKLLNRAKDDFCAKTEIVEDSYISSTVADQRYYTLDDRIIKIKDVWLNDIRIPMLIGKPIIDDDTSESG